MAGYVRVDTSNNIADGNVIAAADLDNEFNGVQAAFNATTGHTHGSAVGEGAPITKLGPTNDVTIGSTLLAPKTSNTVDIGSSSLKYKDLYLAGNASITGTATAASFAGSGASLTGFTSGQVTTALGFTPYNATNPSGYTNNTGTVTSVGGTGTVNGITLTGTVTSTGNLTLGGALSGVNLASQVTGTLPIANGGTGSTSTTFANLTTNVTGTLPIANGGTGTTSTTFANLTTNVTGTLPIANGGTGATTLVGATIATYAGSETLSNKTIEAGTFTNGYTEEVATANTSTAYTIDLLGGTVQILTLTGNCTFTFPTATAGKSFTLLLKQDGTGSRTATWPAAVKWPSGTAPTITATASKLDKYVFTADGTNWYGSEAGKNYTV